MHMVEAFLAAADASGDPVWAERALRIADAADRRGARADAGACRSTSTRAWTPLPDYNADEPRHPFRPYGVTPGHGLEWARLLLHLRAALDDPPDWLRARGARRSPTARGPTAGTRSAAASPTRPTATGRPVVADRFHWVVCEAIATAAVLGDAERERPAREFAERHLIDRERGGWRHELDPENRPAARHLAGQAGRLPRAAGDADPRPAHRAERRAAMLSLADRRRAEHRACAAGRRSGRRWRR